MTQLRLAATAAETTRDNPWPLALLSTNIERVVGRMSQMWVSGQVVEYRHRPSTRLAFFVLRDLDADVSMTVSCLPGVIDNLGDAFTEGASVVVNCQPNYWKAKGSLSLRASEIHISGVGSLLAQIEKLRLKLRQEGLFAAELKKPLPFLPRKIGVICGRNAKALHDVTVNATARWPSVEFVIREVAVQGPHCVGEVCQALAQLDQAADIDVIIIARGGGAVEDLLPFSDEQLVRQASAATTPIVSAIGHETDAPLLDYVADYRASTPTDAARKVVPDYREQLAGISDARLRMRQVMSTLLMRERSGLADIRSRTVMTSPRALLSPHYERLTAARWGLNQAINARIELTYSEIAGLQASLRALLPRAVMERGYTIVRTPSRHVVTSVTEVANGDLVELLFADGSGVAQIKGTRQAPTNSGGTQ